VRVARDNAQPSNDRMNLTKPAQAIELRRLSWCWAGLGQGEESVWRMVAATQAAHDAEQELRVALVRAGGGWSAHIPWSERTDIEIVVPGEDSGPSSAHLHHAAACLASLSTLVADCMSKLMSVDDAHPLFPPRTGRRFYFLGIDFDSPDPVKGEALFTQQEPEGSWEYLYVLYTVEVAEAAAGDPSARTR
jgi:hypothetical protein